MYIIYIIGYCNGTPAKRNLSNKFLFSIDIEGPQ